MLGGGGPSPFFNYTLAFVSQTRKSMENLNVSDEHKGFECQMFLRYYKQEPYV